MRTRTISIPSPVPPDSVRQRLVIATDVRGPAAAQVLTPRPYGPRPMGLPHRGGLSARFVGTDSFAFYFEYQRSFWPIQGRIAPEGNGSRVSVTVDLLPAEFIWPSGAILVGWAMWGLQSWLSRAMAAGLVVFLVHVYHVGSRGALQCAHAIAKYAADGNPPGSE